MNGIIHFVAAIVGTWVIFVLARQRRLLQGRLLLLRSVVGGETAPVRVGTLAEHLAFIGECLEIDVLVEGKDTGKVRRIDRSALAKLYLEVGLTELTFDTSSNTIEHVTHTDLNKSQLEQLQQLLAPCKAMVTLKGKQ